MKFLVENRVSDYKYIINSIYNQVKATLPNHDIIIADDYRSIKIDNNVYRLNIRDIPQYQWIGRDQDLEYQDFDKEKFIDQVLNYIVEDIKS